MIYVEIKPQNIALTKNSIELPLLSIWNIPRNIHAVPNIYPQNKYSHILLINEVKTPNKNINKNTYKDFIGKRIYVRSPMTCKTKGNGYCYKCWGDLYKTRVAKSVELDGVYVSSKFMLLSMKNMHGAEIQTYLINLENFLISSL